MIKGVVQGLAIILVFAIIFGVLYLSCIAGEFVYAKFGLGGLVLVSSVIISGGIRA